MRNDLCGSWLYNTTCMIIMSILYINIISKHVRPAYRYVYKTQNMYNRGILFDITYCHIYIIYMLQYNIVIRTMVYLECTRSLRYDHYWNAVQIVDLIY